MIVGGGLTGTATALACATAGMKPVLLEADAIGHGWTGHSSGLLLPDPGPLFRDVSRSHGLRAAKLVFASWRRASLDAAALLRRLGVRCGLEPRDSLLVAQAGEEKELLREYDAREAAGVSVAWLTRRQVTAVTPLDVPAAMRSRDAFVFDPYRACLGLARAASARGALLFEKSPVKKVRAARKNVEIVTADASVSARTVIVTTGRATAEFRPLQRHFKTRETYAALSSPMPAPMRKQVGDRSVTVRELNGLAVDYGWSTTYGETADGLMYVGAHRNYPRHLFALGGPGDSATGAFLSARILLRALQDAPDKADAMFGWTR